ncbi:hypothetical protein COCSUDRAFT_53242 [Coccomyxa subellipsoidea C-169]|uniref:Uncharacterized protein n=1 Tax=Coccomyxa subellipsoidea (strain C-169) TaxID=574566 RepID=I0Z0I2_COCSC|nr:hypothetical protein COCSUDRAFT_53242 [Coccomyxa subellipsoidea C-169]EIE24151.1 hypothetical protein COCSUDRAFT_53242 [Coccomyxa subellipsoidea C-169]|eukprot:XP_005648695.1 hypothetical protein COCSUDRAFT_53242 [Coccomyxa subellipsoidea C-169]
MRASAILSAKNLYEVASNLQKHGIGHKVQRTTWKEDSFWTITGMKPSLDGKHGKAFGILTWRGRKESEEPRRVNGTLKRVWRCMDDAPVEWVTLKKPSLSSGQMPDSASADTAAAQ